MIYIDATEARDNTRLPYSLVKCSKELTGLEAMTGADILVTPHNDNELVSHLQDILPHRKALEFHCRDGVLIQRKSGGDFLSSVDDLTEIEWRMQEWSDNPWLLVTEVKEGKNGRVVAGGRYFRSWNWQSISGMMDAWQDRGGSTKVLSSDEDIYWWVKSRERRTMVWLKEPVKNVSHKKGKVSRQALRRIQDNWAATGWAFPLGIGKVMRENLAKYVVEVWKRPPTLANAICLACSEEALKVSGWGEVSVNNVQEWYGVNRAVPPDHIGAESGCWIYSLPLRDEPEKKVLIVGGHIIEGDKVYEVVKEELGTVGEPADSSGGIVLM